MSNCPTCRSENTQRAEVAWTMGTSGRSQSLLAGLIAPPAPKSTRAAVIGAAASAVLAIPGALALIGGAPSGNLLPGLLLLSVAAIPLVVGLGVRGERQRYNREVLPGLLAEWSALWVCLKCGHVFTPPEGPREEQPRPTAPGLPPTVMAS